MGILMCGARFKLIDSVATVMAAIAFAYLLSRERDLREAASKCLAMSISASLTDAGVGILLMTYLGIPPEAVIVAGSMLGFFLFTPLILTVAGITSLLSGD